MNLLDTRQAAAYCGLSDRTLEVWRLQQVGPAFFILAAPCATPWSISTPGSLATIAPALIASNPSQAGPKLPLTITPLTTDPRGGHGSRAPRTGTSHHR